MDNRYWSQGCPQLMQDGKFITNYIRGSVYDQYIRNLNNIGGTHEYRNFLQNRGGEIIKLENDALVKNNTCSINGVCVPLSGKSLSSKDKLNVLPCDSCYSVKSFSNQIEGFESIASNQAIKTTNNGISQLSTSPSTSTIAPKQALTPNDLILARRKVFAEAQKSKSLLTSTAVSTPVISSTLTPSIKAPIITPSLAQSIKAPIITPMITPVLKAPVVTPSSSFAPAYAPILKTPAITPIVSSVPEAALTCAQEITNNSISSKKKISAALQNLTNALSQIA